MRMLVLASEHSMGVSMVARLQSEGYAVDLVSSLPRAQVSRSDVDYDCMVLDREALGGDALDWVVELRGRGDTVFTVLLAKDNSSKERLRAFKAGADDYMVKPIDIEELVLRLRRVVARVPAVQPDIPPVQEVGPVAISRALRQVYVNGKRVGLSATQFRLLAYLFAHRGRLVSAAELRSHCWDAHLPSTSDPLPPQLSRVRKAFEGVMELRSPRYGMYQTWIPGVDDVEDDPDEPGEPGEPENFSGSEG